MPRFLCLMLASAVLCAVAAAPAAAAEEWHKGANFTAWWHDAYEQPQSDDSLAALAATGTRRVSIVTTWYMDTPQSSDIRPHALKTPSDASLRHAMQSARAAGMEVVLKPHVDLMDGSFRGDIAPADRSAWFDDYRMMSNHYAELAAEAGATLLIVGTELTSMSGDEGEWRRIIAETRARFGGELTFAANWIDGARRIGFWDALNYVGIDAYMPVGSTPNPSVEEITSAWLERGYVRELEELHQRHGKPVLFTELGYESRQGTAMTPWGGADGPIDQEPQARAFEAAFRAFWEKPWFAGIYWWDWRADGAGPDDGGHPFAGKAAADVVSAWNARTRIFPPPAPTPDLPPPAETPAPAAKEPPPAPVADGPARVTLRLRQGRLEGSVRRDGAPCETRVTVRLSRAAGRARKSARRSRSAGTSSAGTFRFDVRRLAPGRYRAQAVAHGAACGRARSPKLAFRLR